MYNEMLVKLGHTGKAALLALINQTWKTAQLPKCWKNAYIVPTLKKGKDPSD
jgi:hypothetical protein